VSVAVTKGRTIQVDADELDRLRTELGWSIEDLARKADISAGTVYNALAGEGIFRSKLAAMARALGVEAAVLIDGRRRVVRNEDVHEYGVEEVLTPWMEASNGLKFQICRMRHSELDRWARGKRYDLRKMSTEDDERCRAWFKRHADVCYRLKEQPNILNNVTAFRAPSGDYWWVIDDWVDGMTLHKHLERGPLDRKRTRRVMLGVAEGLAALHATKIIRRELNPASIVIAEKDGKPVLTEFELAKLCDGSATVSSDSWPTDLYRAPEADSDDVDFRADLYSWARVSLHALIGELPSVGEDMAIVDHARLPKAVGNLLRQSLSVSRRERPNGIYAVISALKKWKA
jgi:serine/threonine protein kinase